MYNYSFYCSYLDASNNEHNQDTIYRCEILKENNKYSFLFNNSQDLFTLLFSFEYFYYFHSCIAELEQSNSISNIIYEKFIKILKNNNNN